MKDKEFINLKKIKRENNKLKDWIEQRRGQGLRGKTK